MTRTVARTLAFLLLTILLVASPLRAQGTQCVLAGQVVDRSGEPLPGVVVTASSPTAGLAPAGITTDADGRYRLFPLPPARDYTVVAELAGHAKVVASPVSLWPGRTTVINLTLLRTTETMETVTVEVSADLIDLESPQVSTRFNEEFLEGLPILGRTYQDVLTLAPGVTDVDGDGDPNVHGARETGFQTRLDGANVTDPFTGMFGQNLNLESIAAIEVITTGATAEFGQAQGGFANILTKSGGNELEGSFKLFFRSDVFDNDGANTQDLEQRDVFAGLDGFGDLRAFLTLGGPLVRDHLWYFLALEWIDLEQPVNTLTQPGLLTEGGWNNFAKLTWQVNPSHRLAIQANHDPRNFGGLNLDTQTAPESDFTLERDGLSGSVKWGWTASPNLLLETTASWFHTQFGVTPISESAPCDLTIFGTCNRFEEEVYTIDIRQGTTSGPYFQTVQDDRERIALRSDLSYFLDAGGTHSLRAGFELTEENYEDNVLTERVRFEDFRTCTQAPPGIDDPDSPDFIPPGSPQRQTICNPSDLDIDVSSGQTVVIGSVNFEDAFLEDVDRDAEKDTFSLYVQDSWRPLPDLVVNLGLRLDRETSRVLGWSSFEPAEEAQELLELMALGSGRPLDSLSTATVFDDPIVILDVNGDGLDFQHCQLFDIDGDVLGDGMPNGRSDDFWTFFDGDFDGVANPDSPFDTVLMVPDGIPDGSSINPQCDRLAGDAATVLATLSRHQFDRSGGVFVNPNQPDDILGTLRVAETFRIVNNNLAPRLALSWDPWGDNRTKVYATWGRYFDRLFLATLVPEQGPDPRTQVFLAESESRGARAPSVQTGRFSLTQIDRDLKTPFTDEITVGIERELAPEWTLSLGYIRREGRDQLQDVDLNHFTVDANGDGRADDNFGRVGVNQLSLCVSDPLACNLARLPDGQPDLYVYNPFLNQVLRVGNFNSSSYRAWQLSLTRRLSKGWQMTTSYVRSRAEGDAEEFLSTLGNDPGNVEDEFGPLDYDQTHVLKFAAVGWLPREQSLGAAVVWSSGTPYSTVTRRQSGDNFESFFFRTSFPTGQRNDQRNEGIWNVDLSYRKRFSSDALRFSFGVEVVNLLNSDDVVVSSVEPTQLLALDATRRFGRRWQVSLDFHF